MARKNIFDADPAPPSSATSDEDRPADRPLLAGARPQRVVGALGAISKSLDAINARAKRAEEIEGRLENAEAVIELDPERLDPSPFPDRLPDDNDAAFLSLKEGIERDGQKLPIQVRPHPREPGRYQIVFGHRRWRAAKLLGRPLRAVVANLSDSELVVAQGIENAARQDLTWIERALFAWRMDEAGLKARDIRAALGIDDPELARMRSVTRSDLAGTDRRYWPRAGDWPQTLARIGGRHYGRSRRPAPHPENLVRGQGFVGVIRRKIQRGSCGLQAGRGQSGAAADAVCAVRQVCRHGGFRRQ